MKVETKNVESVLVIDPGETCGLALFRKDGDKYNVIFTTDVQWLHLAEQLCILDFDILLYEKIIIHSGRLNPAGLYATGVILNFCNEKHILTHTQVSSAMRYKEKIIFPPKCSEHIKDAITHGVVFLGLNNISEKLLKEV